MFRLNMSSEYYKCLLSPLFVIVILFTGIYLVIDILKKECYFERKRHQNLLLTVQNNIEQNGYALELHNVNKNCNGIYLYRIIPWNRVISDEVILLIHGIFGSPIDWMIGGREKSLGYILTERGYDVWTLDCSNCLSHGKNKTWFDIGVEDFPKILDYIQNIAITTSVTFVGQGAANTALFAMVSEKPEYNKNIKSLISLAPIVYLENSSNELLLKIKELDTKLMLTEVSSNIKLESIAALVSNLSNAKCPNRYLKEEVCSNPAFSFYDYHPLQLEAELVNNAIQYIPKDMNYMQLHHYSQLVQTGKFAKYNYGKNENLERYGTEYAPQYNLRNIQAPVHVVYSRNDSLTNEDDVNKLCRNIKNCYIHDIGDKYVGLDHRYGRDAPKIINDKVISILEKTTSLVDNNDNAENTLNTLMW